MKDLMTTRHIINYDKVRLHAAIMLSFRRRKVAVYLRGADILRGTVVGIIRHPQYTLRTAVTEAVQYSTLPGGAETYEDGLEEIMTCLEGVIHNKDMYDDNGKEIDAEILVEKVVNSIIEDIWKDFCYDAATKYLKEKGWDTLELSTSVLRDMIFKKMVDNSSTRECTYRYALRKVLMENIDDLCEDTVEAKVEKMISRNSVGIKMDIDAYAYASNAVQNIIFANAPRK